MRRVRNRQMCSFKLGMLAAGLAVWVLLMDVSVWVIEVAVAGAESRPTPITAVDRLLVAQKQMVLRTEAGELVQGIAVQLTPADPTIGGPEVGSPAKSAATGSDGTATFTGLGQWIWTASFSGTFRGKAIQPVEEQGRAPYGRTRAGGGFPVMVARQEEDTPATPVVVQGIPQPEVQPSLFVLLETGNNWVPAIDLALPGEPPQPLPLLSATQPTPLVPGTIAATVAATSTISAVPADLASGVSTVENLVQWFYILPIAVALFALYRAWRERRQERRREGWERREGRERQEWEGLAEKQQGWRPIFMSGYDEQDKEGGAH